MSLMYIICWVLVLFLLSCTQWACHHAIWLLKIYLISDLIFLCCSKELSLSILHPRWLSSLKGDDQIIGCVYIFKGTLLQTIQSTLSLRSCLCYDDWCHHKYKSTLQGLLNHQYSCKKCWVEIWKEYSCNASRLNRLNKTRNLVAF